MSGLLDLVFVASRVGIVRLVYSSLLFMAVSPASLILTASATCLLMLLGCFCMTLNTKILQASAAVVGFRLSSLWCS